MFYTNFNKKVNQLVYTIKNLLYLDSREWGIGNRDLEIENNRLGIDRSLTGLFPYDCPFILFYALLSLTIPFLTIHSKDINQI